MSTLGAGMSDEEQVRISRACNPIAFPVTTGSYPLPAGDGFYWAKWIKADQGDAKTAEYESYLPNDYWEVVHVGEDVNAEPHERLFVFVHGVEYPQSLENFFWGPGPLQQPA